MLVAGDGREETALRDQIRREGVEDVVKLLGTRMDVPDLLAGSDVAVCCSDFEGTPLSVMEYMDGPVRSSRRTSGASVS